MVSKVFLLRLIGEYHEYQRTFRRIGGIVYPEAAGRYTATTPATTFGAAAQAASATQAAPVQQGAPTQPSGSAHHHHHHGGGDTSGQSFDVTQSGTNAVANILVPGIRRDRAGQNVVRDHCDPTNSKSVFGPSGETEDTLMAFAVSDTGERNVFESIFTALDGASQEVIGPAEPRRLVIPIHGKIGHCNRGPVGRHAVSLA